MLTFEETLFIEVVKAVSAGNQHLGIGGGGGGMNYYQIRQSYSMLLSEYQTLCSSPRNKSNSESPSSASDEILLYKQMINSAECLQEFLKEKGVFQKEIKDHWDILMSRLSLLLDAKTKPGAKSDPIMDQTVEICEELKTLLSARGLFDAEIKLVYVKLLTKLSSLYSY